MIVFLENQKTNILEGKTIKQKIGDWCGRVILVVMLILTFAVVWQGSAKAQGLDSSCFVFEKAGTELTIYACDYGEYRVVVTLDGNIASGGILTSDTPCPIFYIEKGSKIFIKDEETGEVILEGSY